MPRESWPTPHVLVPGSLTIAGNRPVVTLNRELEIQFSDQIDASADTGAACLRLLPTNARSKRSPQWRNFPFFGIHHKCLLQTCTYYRYHFCALQKCLGIRSLVVREQSSLWPIRYSRKKNYSTTTIPKQFMLKCRMRQPVPQPHAQSPLPCHLGRSALSWKHDDDNGARVCRQKSSIYAISADHTHTKYKTKTVQVSRPVCDCIT